MIKMIKLSVLQNGAAKTSNGLNIGARKAKITTVDYVKKETIVSLSLTISGGIGRSLILQRFKDSPMMRSGKL